MRHCHEEESTSSFCTIQVPFSLLIYGEYQGFETVIFIHCFPLSQPLYVHNSMNVNKLDHHGFEFPFWFEIFSVSVKGVESSSALIDAWCRKNEGIFKLLACMHHIGHVLRSANHHAPVKWMIKSVSIGSLSSIGCLVCLFEFNSQWINITSPYIAIELPLSWSSFNGLSLVMFGILCFNTYCMQC